MSSKLTFTLFNQTIFPGTPGTYAPPESTSDVRKELINYIGIDCDAPAKAFAYDHLSTGTLVSLYFFIGSIKDDTGSDNNENLILDRALKAIFPNGTENTRVKHSEDEIRKLFRMAFFDKDNTIKAACIACDINYSTGSNYVRQAKRLLATEDSVTDSRQPGHAKLTHGNQKIMTHHSKFLSEYYESNEFSSLSAAKAALLKEFSDLQISDSGLYQHLRKKCCLVIKRIKKATGNNEALMSIPRVKNFEDSKDFVFVTTAIFYMYSRKSFGWSKTAAGKVESTLSEEGGIFFTLMAAFCHDGILNISMKTNIKGKRSKINPFDEFMKKVISTMAENKMEKKLLVIDDVIQAQYPKLDDNLSSLGYKSLCLPNSMATDQFWNKLKHEVPRHQLDGKNVFVSRISYAAKSITASDCRDWMDSMVMEDI